MKKFSKILTVMGLAMVMCMAMVITASADDAAWKASVKQSYRTKTSVTVKWDKYVPDSGYTLLGYNIKNMDTGNFVATDITPDKLSFTKKGLYAGFVARYKVSVKIKSKYGSVYEDWTSAYIDVNTTPAKPALGRFTADTNYDMTNVEIYCNKPDQMTGYRVQLTNTKNGSTRKFSSKYDYSDYRAINKNTVYKYRIRYYFTNETNKQTIYGPWSNWKAFDAPKAKLWNVTTTNGCKVQVTGVKNVSKYKIYVSKSSSALGKLSKTVYPKKGVTKAYLVNKHGSNKMKKSQTYYVTVVPVIKINGTVYKNPIRAGTSFYNSWY